MHYAALIGDLVGSRQVDDRQAVQSRLHAALAELNEHRSDNALTSPYTVTLGDEFQALLSSTQGVWRQLSAIDAALYPVRIRYAIGLGEIHTRIDPDKAIGMDGPAFHHARDAMDTLKTSGHGIGIRGQLTCQGVIDPALTLFSLHRDKWRDNRIRIFAGRLSGMRVDTLSETLSISEQAVYQNINDGALDVCEALLAGISEAMDRQLAAHEPHAERGIDSDERTVAR